MFILISDVLNSQEITSYYAEESSGIGCSLSFFADSCWVMQIKKGSYFTLTANVLKGNILKQWPGILRILIYPHLFPQQFIMKEKNSCNQLSNLYILHYDAVYV